MAAQSGRYFSAGLAGLVVNVITKEQLKTMSDMQVNQLLSCILGGSDWQQHGNLTDDGWSFYLHNAIGDPYYLDVLDFCGNLSEIIPMAFERKICIDWFSDGRCLATFGGLNEDFDYQSTNPLRAIACCLILVLQEKQQ